MLAAMLLLGLLPLAALPILHDEAPDPDDDEMGGAPVAAPVPGPEDGAVHEVGAGSGAVVIADFEPGRDLVEVDLTGIAGDPVFEVSAPEDGARVVFPLGGDAAVSVGFPGLSAVPAGDILLKLAEQSSGAVYVVSLAEAIDGAGTHGDDGGADVLDPDDPDAPGEPGPVVDPAEVLEPDDPDAPGTPGPLPGDGGVIDPDPPDAGEPGRGTAAGIPVVEGFRAGEDVLRVILQRDAFAGAPEIRVAPSPDGADALVTVDGTLVAVLPGAPDATAADIHVDDWRPGAG